MSVAKVIEISAQSPESFEAAIQEGLKTAGKTVKNIEGAWINEQKVVVHEGAIKGYQIDMKVTFVLD